MKLVIFFFSMHTMGADSMKKIRWGILSTAKIAVERVIPAMQRGELIIVSAISSRCKVMPFRQQFSMI